MSHQLSFAVVHQYDLRKTGITVPALLHSGDKTVDVRARLDTGASFCIFRRELGELLGLEIESGLKKEIGTATGTFIAYGHEVLLRSLGIEMTTTVYFAAAPGFDRDVLGRQGWLDRLRAGIVDHDGLLYISRYDDPA